MDITITNAAEKFIKRMLRFGGGPQAGFRLVVKTGGCSGLSGEFTVEAEPKSGDAVVDKDGMKLFLPAESRLLLTGVTIDFADTPTQTGLVFHDPKTTGGSCSSSGSSKDSLPGTASIAISSIARRH
jgi:iron-sulfur cluster assembly protein